MNRRADAPQTTNADTPRAAELRRAALDCVKGCKVGEPNDCPLHDTIPDHTDPDTDTLAAFEALTGHPLDLHGPGLIPARLRAALRRWGIRHIFND